MWRQVDAIIAELLSGVSNTGPSAVAVRIADRSGVLGSWTRGYRQTQVATEPLDAPPALGPGDVFDLGSITKVVGTTASLMRLVDSGDVDLDRPVRTWLGPVVAGPAGDAHVRDLLEHQGGLWEWWPTYVAGARGPAEGLELVGRLEPRYLAGTGRHYSDLGFLLLGALVSQVVEASLDVAVRRLVTEPLDMRHTGYTVAHAPAVATSHGDWFERRMVATGRPYPVPLRAGDFGGWRNHTLVGEVNDGNAWHTFGGVAGHAGLFSSADDLVRFGRALLASRAGDGLWSRAVVEQFTTTGRDPGQALGFWHTTVDGIDVVGHPGFPGTRFAIIAEQERIVALLTNRLHTHGEPIALDEAWQRLLEVVVRA